MKDYNQEDYLMLSGIQHYAFCKRQWALIHIENQWSENYHTAMGNIMHERAHNSNLSEKRNNVIISRAIPIYSHRLKISGECDVVEFHKNEMGVKIVGREEKYIPYPIEYKKGSPKENLIDILQLVAQAMCLEEMFLCKIDCGYIYYGTTKRRLKVDISDELKEKVIKMTSDMHSLYRNGHTPKAKKNKGCDSCSLQYICLPKTEKTKSASKYIEDLIRGG